MRVAASGLALRPVTGFRALPGYGDAGVADGRRLLLGNAELLRRHGVGLALSSVSAVANAALLTWRGRADRPRRA